MVKGGFKRRNVPDENEQNNEEEADFCYIYNNVKIQKIVGSLLLENFVNSQYLKYIGHICRSENTRLTKSTIRKTLKTIPS